MTDTRTIRRPVIEIRCAYCGTWVRQERENQRFCPPPRSCRVLGYRRRKAGKPERR